MEHKLHRKYKTRDGHIAYVYKKRNALGMFRYVYYVSIMSMTVHQVNKGYRNSVIYGWHDSDEVRVKKEVEEWDLSKLFLNNTYLLTEARKYLAHATP